MRLRNDGNIQYIAERPRILQAAPTVSLSPAHANGDSLWNLVEIKAIDPNAGPDSSGNGTLPAFSRPGGHLTVNSVTIIGTDSQILNHNLFFFRSNVTSFGAANAAEALSDADSEFLIGQIQVPVSAYQTPQPNEQRLGIVSSVGMVLFAGPDSDKLYVGGRTVTTSDFVVTNPIRLILKCTG